MYKRRSYYKIQKFQIYSLDYIIRTWFCKKKKSIFENCLHYFKYGCSYCSFLPADLTLDIIPQIVDPSIDVKSGIVSPYVDSFGNAKDEVPPLVEDPPVADS